MIKSAKGTLVKLLKHDALEGRISPLEHQRAYDILKNLEDGHDLYYYIKEIGGHHA